MADFSIIPEEYRERAERVYAAMSNVDDKIAFLLSVTVRRDSHHVRQETERAEASVDKPE